MDGRLYSGGGDNSYNEIGWYWGLNLGTFMMPVGTWIFSNLRSYDTRFISCAAGRFHAGAIDIDGNAWTWGINGFGQGGRRRSGSAMDPNNVPDAPIDFRFFYELFDYQNEDAFKFSHLSLSEFFSIFIVTWVTDMYWNDPSYESDVREATLALICGRNDYGQFGFAGDTGMNPDWSFGYPMFIATYISDELAWVPIAEAKTCAAGASHSVIVLKDGGIGFDAFDLEGTHYDAMLLDGIVTGGRNQFGQTGRIGAHAPAAGVPTDGLGLVDPDLFK
jgi:alpha-tubulin suppressor-like RCC1 family protein